MTEIDELRERCRLLEAECRAWRKACDEYTGDVRVVYGQAGHIAAIVEARKATDAAGALRGEG